MKALFHGSAEAGHSKALRNTGSSTRSQRPSVCWRRRGGGGPQASEGHVRHHRDSEDGERHEAGEGAAPGRREAGGGAWSGRRGGVDARRYCNARDITRQG